MFHISLNYTHIHHKVKKIISYKVLWYECVRDKTIKHSILLFESDKNVIGSVKTNIS